MVQDTLKDGTMGAKRLAKIPTKEVTHIIDELDMDGFVKTELYPDLFELFRAGARTQIARRRVGRNNPRKCECDGTEPQQYEHKPQSSSYNIAQHGYSHLIGVVAVVAHFGLSFLG